MTPEELWAWMPRHYLLTILIETPILLVGLSARHSWKVRLFCGVWLTACTYPIVVLVLPLLIPERTPYLIVAETFAPVAECALFWVAFGKRELVNTRSMWQDLLVIIVANLASFGIGEWINELEYREQERRQQQERENSQPADDAVGDQQQQGAADGDDDTAHVELRHRAEAEMRGDVAAENGAGDADQRGDDQPAAVLAWQEQLGDHPRHQPQHDPRHDAHEITPCRTAARPDRGGARG
jgi:hypothetical protein